MQHVIIFITKEVADYPTAKVEFFAVLTAQQHRRLAHDPRKNLGSSFQ